MPREIGRDAVQRLMAEGAQLVEVLSAEEYAREHIAGAISIPLGRLAKEADKLRRDRAVIVYCYDSQ
jgi:rhodanese-related sulfurtransferase